MSVYLIHLEKPLARGVSPDGQALKAGHYIGYTEDLVGRILDHGDTTWEPLDEPVTLEDGRICTGAKHGPGATFMGVANTRGIGYELARTWEGPGADRMFERRLKNYKNAPRLCPVCDPERALERMRLELSDV